jgi:3-oxoacyl-[acyl-carrier protein] reductase
MDIGLKGKKVIMNGGAHGLGLSSLKQFVAEGADVAFFSRDQAKVDAAVNELQSGGTTVHGGVLDMSNNADGYKAWLTAAAEKLGGCDIFVHMASSSGQGATQDWQRGLDMDIMGAVNGVEALTPALVASGAGSIILMSSTAAYEDFIMPQAFNALKAALTTYGSQLATALAPQNVRVNMVSPGPVYYPGGNWEMIEGAMPEFFAGTLAQMPMGRWCTPQEVANTVVFLASPASSYTSGTNVVVDGAFTKRVQF